ncbi:MAG: septum formation family protein [Acidimicrobiales bacterium]|nr:septum formation family protein [Acidimicrobiales bacterium]
MADRRRQSGGEAAAWLAALGGAALAGALLAVALWGALGAGDGAPASASPRRTADVAPAPLSDPVPTTAAGRPGAAGSDAAGSDAADPAVTSTTAAGAAVLAYQPAVGDCVAVVTGADGAAAVASVDCAATHLFEVAALVDVSAQFASRPTDLEWTALLTMRCPDLLRAYVGPTYDPHGRFVLRVSAPTEAEWAAGDRLGECLVSVGSDSAGRPIPYEGGVRGADQSVQLRPGDCVDLGPLAGMAPTVVGCDEAHELEVLGALDLTGSFEHYPADDEWAGAAAQCLPALTERFGVDPVAPNGNALVPSVVRIPIESWLVGRRSTACAVGELDAAGALVERITALDS